MGSIVTWVEDVIEQLGYWGIAALVALENVFPPIPSEIILPLGGSIAAQGRLNLIGVIIAATIGALIGAGILYGLGYWFGEPRVRRLIRRYGRFALLTEEDLDKAISAFDRYGGYVVGFGRLLPVIRSLVSIPAGLNHMPIGTFLLYTTAGSLVWNSVLVGGGYVLRQEWHRVADYADLLQTIVLIAIALIGAWYLYSRREALASLLGRGSSHSSRSDAD